MGITKHYITQRQGHAKVAQWPTCIRAVSAACSCILSSSVTTTLSLDSRDAARAAASALLCASCGVF